MVEIDWYLKEGEKDVTAADLMVEALLKLSVSSFNELIRHSGKAEALAAVRPYRKWGAEILIEEVKKKLNMQSNGPETMLSIQLFGGLDIVSPDGLEGEIRERGAVGVARDCALKNGSPELCVSTCHFISEAIAEAVNPEYECIFTHHGSTGDPYCRLVFKKKSDPISVLDDMGKTLMVLPKFEVTKKELQAVRLWGLAGFAFSNMGAFLDLHGEEKTDEVIGALAGGIGRELGEKIAEQNPEMTRSVASIGKLLRAMENSLGQRDNFVIVSENEVSNEITDCSQIAKPSQRWCITLESLFKGMVSAIDPDYEFSYDRMIKKGDKSCHWTLKKMNGSKLTDDPLKVLKMRFAKGELSKEEYLEMKTLLGG